MALAPGVPRAVRKPVGGTAERFVPRRRPQLAAVAHERLGEPRVRRVRVTSHAAELYSRGPLSAGVPRAERFRIVERAPHRGIDDRARRAHDHGGQHAASHPTSRSPAQATPKPLPEIASEMGIGEHLLEPYGRERRQDPPRGDRRARRPPAGEVRRRHRDHADAARRGQDHHHRRARPGDEAHRQARRDHRSASRRWARRSGSRAAPPAAATARSSRWSCSTSTSPATSTPSPPPTTCSSAMLDNHLHQGNELGLDLAQHHVAAGARRQRPGAAQHRHRARRARQDGVVRQTGFDITAASEVMAILALATSAEDLRARLGRIVVGYTEGGEPVTAEQLHGAGSMAVIMREAIKPNLLQTLENTPVIVHAGPFGNIAHGNSSIVGDLIGIRGGDYLITEAGFGADMGAERFFNIKCRDVGSGPGRRRARRHRAGAQGCTPASTASSPGRPLPPETARGEPRRRRGRRGQPAQADRERARPTASRRWWRSTRFPTDHASEHDVIRRVAEAMGARVAVCTHFADGGAGATDLARAVVEACDEPSDFRFLYPDSARSRRRSRPSRRTIYGAERVEYSPVANKPARHVRAQRLRPPPGVHRQDPPVDLRRRRR